jgi:predicted nuclease with RNAse H fold
VKPEIFIGIDLAYAKNKQLPLCIATLQRGQLVPIETASMMLPEIPRGRGNVGALETEQVMHFAQAVMNFLKAVELQIAGRIVAIAIDAPSSYSADGRRKCEQAMDARGISCFATPTRKKFDEIRQKVQLHLNAGGPENRLPHANQLWMLVGFALFDVLGKQYRCLEVFPQAIARVLGSADVHKFKKSGVENQLTAIADQTGWDRQALQSMLSKCVPGPLHDQVDAFMCAWVASLYPDGLEACGEPPDDVIWIPHVDRVGIPAVRLNYSPAVIEEVAQPPHGGCLCCERQIQLSRPRICPECTHVFRGVGWGGIDAHWRARHEDVMTYEAFWGSLCEAHRAE